MNAPLIPLADDNARRHGHCNSRPLVSVEAGAGSGKTAIMVGRIALMLAEVIAPKTVAAVTFTELAASELLIRVREFVGELAAGRIPAELRRLASWPFRRPQSHLSAAIAPSTKSLARPSTASVSADQPLSG